MSTASRVSAALPPGAPSFGDIAPDVLRLPEGIRFRRRARRDVRDELLPDGAATRRAPRQDRHFLDTLVLSRRAFALPSHSLDALSLHLGITRERAHRAGDDVLALRVVFERAVEVLAPATPRDLWEVRVAERRARAAIVDACVAAAEKRIPVRVVYRPSRRKPEPLDMILTEVRTGLDPPRVIGYQLPGRGLRDLRSDRILRVEPADQAAEQSAANFPVR